MLEKNTHHKFYDVDDLRRNKDVLMKNAIKMIIWRNILVIIQSEVKLKAHLLVGK